MLTRSGMTTEDVTRALREMILDGTFPASTWLREADLAEALKVSRTPVREALRLLADEQLVEREANRGCRVRPMTFDDALAVYAVRENLEGLAARAAAAGATQGLVNQLRELQTQMEAPDLTGQERAMLNLQFHAAIRNASGNSYLDVFLTQVEHAVRRFGNSSFENPDRMEEIHQEHEAIISAIEAEDPDAAETAASHHMRKARDARIQHLMRGMGRA